MPPTFWRASARLGRLWPRHYLRSTPHVAGYKSKSSPTAVIRNHHGKTAIGDNQLHRIHCRRPQPSPITGPPPIHFPVCTLPIAVAADHLGNAAAGPPKSPLHRPCHRVCGPVYCDRVRDNIELSSDLSDPRSRPRTRPRPRFEPAHRTPPAAWHN